MNIKVYNKNNFYEYKELLANNELSLDIYYQPEFLDIEAGVRGGEFEIFTLTKTETRQVFIYPYIKVSLTEEYPEYFDITSPYGYAGPYCNDNLFFSQGEDAFVKYIRTQNILTEFVRYHFLYNKEMRFSKKIINELNRSLVVIDLRKDWTSIWMNGMSMNNRNHFRRLEREGYTFEINESTEHLDEFVDVYYQTMKNASADNSFYFEREYFYQLFTSLHGKVKLARVVKDGITYSAVIFFISGNILHYYLMGRNLDYPKVPSSIPLYINIAKWAKEIGVELLNIGGGLTNSPDDMLFKFKKSYSKQIMPFYIGKRIHNPVVYQQLIDTWISDKGVDAFEKVKHILQFYR